LQPFTESTAGVSEYEVIFISSEIMPRSQKNDNFIDKTFTIIADLLLRVLPTTQREKEAFAYYRDGVICP